MVEHKTKAETDVLTVSGTGIWEHYSIVDGLPDLKIESLAQDSRGAMWVGTHDCGVARKDGDRFTCFNKNDGLAGNSVYSITEDHDGRLWFGTNRGLTIYDGAAFETVLTDEPFGLLWGSHCSQNGDLWFGLGRRPGRPAAVCRASGGSIQVFNVRDKVEEFGESIHAIWQDNEGLLWIGGDSLYCCEVGPGGDNVQSRPVDTGPIGVRAIQGDGEAVMVADSHGVWRIDDLGSVIAAELPAPGAYSLVSGGNMSDWLVSGPAGVFTLGSSGHELVREFSRPVLCTATDSVGGLWVGTYGSGLYHLDEAHCEAFRVSGGDIVNPMCVAGRADGRVVIGTESGIWLSNTDGGIERDKHLEQLPITSLCVDGECLWAGGYGWIAQICPHAGTTIHELPGGEGVKVSSICREGVDGHIWYAASPGWGVGVLNPPSGSEHFGPENDRGLPVWVGDIMFSPSRNCLCLGTQEGAGADGLFEVGEAAVTAVGAPQDLTINAIAEYDGARVIGTSAGVFELSEGCMVPLAPDHVLSCQIITCLHFDAGGSLWIGTEGGGIGRYDGHVLVPMRMPGGIAYNNVRGIATDAQGNAWIATEGGLLRYSSRPVVPTLQIKVVADGIALNGTSPSPVSSGTSIHLEFLDGGLSCSQLGLVHQYRIVGRDEAWKTARATSVNLGVLPAGSHRIQCRVVDCDLRYSGEVVCSLDVEADNRDLLMREAFAEQTADLLGQSSGICDVRAALAQVAPSDMTVLILGETGTGKSVAAKILHSLSSRSGGPFVQVNCGAIAETLSEAELFGHEKGAFTGAVTRRVGKLQLAHGGTIFLDEIGDLPLSIQAKLLHVLQDRVVEPVGSTREIRIDVRIVAATNRDLEAAVTEGRFRQDLMYRLNAFTVGLPPLRTRSADLPQLARHFVAAFARHLDRPCPDIQPEAMRLLFTYDWPGNVRELEHMMQRAVVLAANTGQITASELAIRPTTLARSTSGDSGDVTLAENERAHIQRVLDQTDWVVQGSKGAAKILGINASTLRSRMKKLGILRQGNGRGISQPP